MLKEYRWRGSTWQIDDKDLARFPGAELIEAKKPDAKKRTTPQNKSRRAQNK